MTEPNRNAEHRRDTSLEQLLAQMNAIVQPSAQASGIPKAPVLPPVFVVGVARSGTTLLMQWLASSGNFAYPSNISSRFFCSPRFGAMVHRAFVDLDSRGELCGRSRPSFISSLGKTEGPAAPHEFWYFWRRFFKFGELSALTPSDLAEVDVDGLRAELAGFEDVFAKPIAMKAMILDWHLPTLLNIFPNAILLWVTRPTASTASSLLEARRVFYGDETAWYSFKPPEYHLLQGLSPVEQVVGQVLATESVIREARAAHPEAFMTVEYEAFCAHPHEQWVELSQLMVARGGSPLPAYAGPPSFDLRKRTALEPFERAEERVAHLLGNVER